MNKKLVLVPATSCGAEVRVKPKAGRNLLESVRTARQHKARGVSPGGYIKYDATRR
jgi:hypothetical protein